MAEKLEKLVKVRLVKVFLVNVHESLGIGKQENMKERYSAL